jgi:hypothetical protein
MNNTPYKKANNSDNVILDSHNNTVAGLPDSQTSDFIITACNSHKDFLELIEEIETDELISREIILGRIKRIKENMNYGI